MRRSVKLCGCGLQRSPEIELMASTQEDSDRKSTRLNSSHVRISYAVFCLKKKKKNFNRAEDHPWTFRSWTGDPFVEPLCLRAENAHSLATPTDLAHRPADLTPIVLAALSPHLPLSCLTAAYTNLWTYMPMQLWRSVALDQAVTETLQS